MENKKIAGYVIVVLFVSLLMLSGCAGNEQEPKTNSEQLALSSTQEYSSSDSSPSSSDTGSSDAGDERPPAASNHQGIKLTLIKFHGNSQCVSCMNLGKFANATLEQNFKKELDDGKIKYLDINAEADYANPYVQKYRPTHASLYLLTESTEGEKYEELVQAWYYTGDKAQYSVFLTKLLKERLNG